MQHVCLIATKILFIYYRLKQVIIIQPYNVSTPLDTERLPGCIKYLLYKCLNIQPNSVKSKILYACPCFQFKYDF